MRYHDTFRNRSARAGSPPPDLSPVEKAVAAVGVLAVGAWLLVTPLAVAVVLVAVGFALLLVGLPLAVVRTVLRLHVALTRWSHDHEKTGVRVRRESDSEASDSATQTATAE